MTREPWDITPDMYLRPEEVDSLLRLVRGRSGQARSQTAALSRRDERRPAPAEPVAYSPAAVAAESLTATAGAVQDRVIIETLLFSGLRTSEFCRLRVADAPVRLDSPCTSDALSLRVRAEGGGERSVWLPTDVARLIAEYVTRHRPALLRDGVSPRDATQPLVLNERGNAFDRTALYRRVVRILADAGLGERASVQLLRHTYGYLAYLRTGGNLLFVQRQLGHAHPMVTSVYAKLVEEDYAALAERVAAAQVAEPLRRKAGGGNSRRVGLRGAESNSQKSRMKRKETSR